MFTADVAFNVAWLDAIHAAAEVLPEAVGRFARRDLRPFVSQAVDRTLRREPGPVVYPFLWASDKQRRAFFATDGFGSGIPYRRTRRYIHSWHVIGDYTDTFSGITVYSDSEVSEFVGGRRQQPGHQQTGWPNAIEVIQVISLEVNDRIEVGLPLVLDDWWREHVP
jgi:hypothetical protein